MSRRHAWFAWTVLFLTLAAPAQEASQSDDLRFVDGLRAHRYNDLALEFLLRLEKSAPPALQAELAYEIAKTRLEAAGDEPDTAKRLAEYQKAQETLKKFLAANPKHRRAGEVKLDIARVGVLRGRTELSRAWLQETTEGRVQEGLKARATFVESAKDLQAACTEVGKEYDLVKEGAARESATPAEKAQAKKLQDDYLHCELERALNLFDQAVTYLDEDKDAVRKARSDMMTQARQALEKVGAMDDTNPICWQAQAWAARCYNELGDPKKARQAFTQILGAPPKVAAEGQRLARYFRLLVISESPDRESDKDPNGIILEAGNRWLVDYPSYSKSTEAMGLRYLLAKTNLARTKDKPFDKNKQQQAKFLADARRLLREIEQTENEYTERARRQVFGIMAEQGGFKQDIARLPSFEDCYYRALYEMSQTNEDAKTIKDEKALEAKRKERSETVIKALQLGLTKPDAKGKAGLEINNAKAILAFYCLGQGRYQDAVDVGEAFARFDPRASQAGMAAVYALQAYTQLVAERERKMATPEELKSEKDKMIALAKYMKERWPGELAGNMARHQLGLMLLREKNIAEAIQEFAGITQGYHAYTITQAFLAEACQQAERDKLPPIPGDMADGYRKRAIAALETIPDLPAGGADPMTNQMYLMSRVKLLQEWFKLKNFEKYKAMQQTAKTLRDLVKTLKLNDAMDKDKEMHEYFNTAFGDLELYGLYGQAQADFDQKKFAEVAALLDDLVKTANDAVKAGQTHQVIENQQLGNVLLGMALRANIQLGKLDNARPVIPLLRELAKKGGGEAGAVTTLRQLQAIVYKQMEEIDKKKDEAALTKMKAGFTTILDDLTKQEVKPSAEFTFALAQNYSLMGEHKKAAELLEKAPAPAKDNPQALKQHQAIRLLFVRQLRLSEQLDKAKPILFDEIIGTKEQPGWGIRNIDALKERVYVMEADGNFAGAAVQANTLVQNLVKKAPTDNALKEQYLECYYHVVYSFLMHGKNQSDAANRAKTIKKAAEQIIALEKRWMGFGSDASEKRFKELLDKELELKQVYEELKKAEAGAAGR
jgi:tetratricopeptide (TPR) repeat protein